MQTASRTSIQSSYVYQSIKQSNIVYEKEEPKNNRPFIPHEIDQQRISIDDKNINILTKQSLPTHHQQFLSYVLACLKIDKDIEKLQESLQSDPLFSTRHLFDFFDINGDRSIQFQDFFLTMQKLDILLKREDLHKLFNRLGGEDDDIISYAEFQELFSLKTSQNKRFFQTSNLQPFQLTQDQQLRLKEMFMNYVNVERSLEYLRSQIGDHDSLMDIFKVIDKQLQGFITLDDIHQFMQKLGVIVQKDDLKRFCLRIQKYKSGRINFQEFLEEFGNLETLQYEKDQELQLIESQIAVHRSRVVYSPNQSRVKENQKIHTPTRSVTPPKPKVNPEDLPPIPGFTKYSFFAEEL